MPFTPTAAYDLLVHDVLLSEIRQEVVAVVPHLIGKSCRNQSFRVARRCAQSLWRRGGVTTNSIVERIEQRVA